MATITKNEESGEYELHGTSEPDLEGGNFMEELTNILVSSEFVDTLNQSIGRGELTAADGEQVATAYNEGGVQAGLHVVQTLHPELFSVPADIGLEGVEEAE